MKQTQLQNELSVLIIGKPKKCDVKYIVHSTYYIYTVVCKQSSITSRFANNYNFEEIVMYIVQYSTSIFNISRLIESEWVGSHYM